MRFCEWFGVALCWSAVNAHMNPQKHVFIADILERYHVTRCIWFNNNLADIGPRVKYLSERNIMTVVMNHERLTHRLLGRRRYPHKEALVTDFFAMDWRWLMRIRESYPYASMSSLLWIVFFRDAWEIIQNVQVPYNCNFLLAIMSQSGYDLYEFYSLKGNSYGQFYGDWNSQTRAVVTASNKSFYRRRMNFFGSQLVLLRNQPWTYANDFERANLDFWFSMAKMMNFSTLVVTQHSAEELGKNLGIYPDVSSQATVFHSLALDKSPLIYYSIAPIWKISMFMYVRHETDGISQWMSYFRAFSWHVWLAAALLLLLSSVCLIIMVKTTVKDFTNLLIVEYGLAPLDTICNQCGSFVREELSHRWLTAALRLQSLIFYHAYSGMVISILTLQYPKYPFTDIVGFVADGSFQLGAVNSTFGIGYFQYSNHPMAQIIATRLFVDEDKLPTNSKEGLQRCCLGHYAFLGHEDVLFQMGPLPCRILKIPAPAFVTFAGMALSPYSEFKTVFFTVLIRMYENGFTKRFKTAQHIDDGNNGHLEEVELSQMRALFSILYFGFFLSCVIFAIEKRIAPKRKVNNSVALFVYDGLCYKLSPESEIYVKLRKKKYGSHEIRRSQISYI